jgi:predicted metalloprotease with PDZ domain
MDQKGWGMRVALAVGLLFATMASASADDAVRYALSPVVTKGKLEALAIEVRFRGDADGETIVRLPNEWGGKRELYQGVRDLKIDGAGVAVEVPAPDKRIVRHRPGAELRLRYRAVQYWPGVPAVTGDNEYRPVVQPGYFHVLGNAIFVTPDNADDNFAASFAVQGLPRGWSFASDLEHGAMGRRLTLGDILESVLVGGDFRVLKRGLVRVAIRGTWSFTDDEFVGRLQPIIASHHQFWGDGDEPYLVTVLPLETKPGSRSLGGTGRSDAFAFFATDNAEGVALNRILAHEHLHTWIPRRIGSMPEPENGDERNEARDYWLSEGFTDFYTARLLLRDGIWSLEEYGGELNTLLFEYGNSPVRTAPNSRIVADFWNDPNVGKLPYHRGQLLATVWDYKVRAATKGARDLDDVVLAMKARAAGLAKPPLASQLFVEEMKRAGVDVGEDMARFVEKGEAVLLPGDVFAPCGTLATLNLPAFDRGFDPQKTAEDGNKIAGLREDSSAYRAGLRNGMQIVKRESGKPGDARVPLSYRVLDNGVERVITYQPEGAKRVTLQEFTLKAGMLENERKACVARLGGA